MCRLLSLREGFSRPTLSTEISSLERPHTHNQRHGRPITQMGVKAHGLSPLGAYDLDATPCEPWWCMRIAILIEPCNQGGELGEASG